MSVNSPPTEAIAHSSRFLSKSAPSDGIRYPSILIRPSPTAAGSSSTPSAAFFAIAFLVSLGYEHEKDERIGLRSVEGKLAETRRNQSDIPHALTSAGENETDARLPASPLSLVTENDIPFSLHVPSSMTASLGALERR